jgi:hypothetical protein
MTIEGALGQEELGQNRFVEMVMPNPSQPKPPMTEFEGLLGKSTSPDALRLYFGSELDLFMEFQRDPELHIESIPKEQTGLGFDLQRVWMKPETRIEVICRSRRLEEGMTAELLAILLMPQTTRGHRHR